MFVFLKSYSWLFLPKHKLELMFSTIEHYAPRRRYLAGNLFSRSSYHKHVLMSPSILTSQWRDSFHVFSDCQPISSAQSSPVYARDPSWSSLAIQSSCWTQAFISPPTLPVSLISLLLPLFDRELFRRLLVHIHSIGDVIPSTSIVKNGEILVIPF